MSSKWKENLHRSGLLLEFDAARTLVAAGFSVDADYSYSRADHRGAKDFSVDIHATAYAPFADDNKIEGDLDLLVECKRRIPGTTWLFLPEPNRPDLSRFTAGNTVQVVDEFSYHIVSSDTVERLEEALPVCYKGVEVRTNGSVHANEFDEGITQLRYAVPRLLARSATDNLLGHQEDNVPFALTAILLTTADLMVVREDLTLEDVGSAESVEALGKSVPYLILCRDYGPDFENHCSAQLQECKQLNEYKQMTDLLARLKRSEDEAARHRARPLSRPSDIARHLAEARRWILLRFFTQFLICTTASFEVLIDKIQKSVEVAFAGRRPI